jgi:hypothetical protein
MMLHPGGPPDREGCFGIAGSRGRRQPGTVQSGFAQLSAHQCDPGGDIPGLVVHRHTPPFAEYRVLDKTAPAVES